MIHSNEWLSRYELLKNLYIKLYHSVTRTQTRMTRVTTIALLVLPRGEVKRSRSTQGHHLNKLCWVQAPNAAYQAPRSLAFWFRRRRFLKCFYHILAWWPSWSCDPDPPNKLSFPHPIEAPYEIWLWLAKQFLRRRYSKTGIFCVIQFSWNFTVSINPRKLKSAKYFPIFEKFVLRPIWLQFAVVTYSPAVRPVICNYLKTTCQYKPFD